MISASFSSTIRNSISSLKPSAWYSKSFCSLIFSCLNFCPYLLWRGVQCTRTAFIALKTQTKERNPLWLQILPSQSPTAPPKDPVFIQYMQMLQKVLVVLRKILFLTALSFYQCIFVKKPLKKPILIRLRSKKLVLILFTFLGEGGKNVTAPR